MMGGKTGIDFTKDRINDLFDKIVEKMKGSDRGFPLDFTVGGGGHHRVLMVTELISDTVYLIDLSYFNESIHMKFIKVGMTLEFSDDFGRVGKDLDEWASDVASHISSLLDGFAFMDWTEAKTKINDDKGQ